MKLQVDDILMLPEFQPRAEINSETVQEYAEAMKEGATFPPVTVYKNEKGYYLTDGWHRVLAAKIAKIATIQAEVKNGSHRDALLASIRANITNGLHRTNADKRRAVLALLKDSEWSKWSDREVARQVAVSHNLVAELRLNGTSAIDKPREILFTNRYGDTSLRRIEPKELNFDKPTNPTIAESVRVKPQFNRTNDNIEWAAWSWNPVTGCQHDCKYCYARDIANRFYSEGFKPTYHPERLNAPTDNYPVEHAKIAKCQPLQHRLTRNKPHRR